MKVTARFKKKKVKTGNRVMDEPAWPDYSRGKTSEKRGAVR
jgi:hypothetical protein